MAKRNAGSSPVSGTPKSGSAKKRPPLTVVKKPKPWGTIIGGLVLAAALIGIVVYAATNQGSGATDPLAEGDRIPGVQVTPEDDISANHVSGEIDYEQMPPNNGEHAPPPLWQTCAVYDEPIAPEHAVHSLEHGAVWITYQPDLPEDQIEELADKVEGERYRLMSPLAEQDSPIILTAWGRTLMLDSADDERVDQFLDVFTGGPQSPEPGAACEGGVTGNTLVTG